MYFVYAISSLSKNYIYVGMTSDINARVNRHNKGYEKTTSPYRPFEIIYTEECLDRIKAREREKYWKTPAGKNKLRILRDNRAGEAVSKVRKALFLKNFVVWPSLPPDPLKVASHRTLGWETL